MVVYEAIMEMAYCETMKKWFVLLLCSCIQDAGGGSEIFEFIPATDADSGNNQRLIYRMSGDDARFILNRVTGRLQISPTGLDRETKSSYTLVINVTDEGIPQQYVS